MKNNCNSGNAEAGVVGRFDGNNNRPNMENNYSIIGAEPLPTTLFGGFGNHLAEFTPEDSEMKGFTAGDASTVVTSLNAWVTTQNQNAGETVYKRWKINDAGVPEVDLGDLDNQ